MHVENLFITLVLMKIADWFSFWCSHCYWKWMDDIYSMIITWNLLRTSSSNNNAMDDSFFEENIGFDNTTRLKEQYFFYRNFCLHPQCPTFCFLRNLLPNKVSMGTCQNHDEQSKETQEELHNKKSKRSRSYIRYYMLDHTIT